MIKRILEITLAVTLLANVLLVNANTYTNTATSSIGPLGAITSNIGEVFTSSGGVLTDWAFYSGLSANMPVKLTIANWNGSQATGPALYTSLIESTLYGGGPISFTGINTALTNGNYYIAYLSSSGINGYFTPILTSNTDGGLGGHLAYLNSATIDPLILNTSWLTTSSTNSYLNFSATIVAVPEPSTYVLMLGGLGLIGFIVRRRKNKHS